MREPNDKTKLLTLRREMKETSAELYRVRVDRDAYRMRATRSETDAAEWKRRFDLLLSKLEAKVPERGEGEK